MFRWVTWRDIMQKIPCRSRWVTDVFLISLLSEDAKFQRVLIESKYYFWLFSCLYSEWGSTWSSVSWKMIGITSFQSFMPSMKICFSQSSSWQFSCINFQHRYFNDVAPNETDRTSCRLCQLSNWQWRIQRIHRAKPSPNHLSVIMDRIKFRAN